MVLRNHGKKPHVHTNAYIPILVILLLSCLQNDFQDNHIQWENLSCNPHSTSPLGVFKLDRHPYSTNLASQIFPYIQSTIPSCLTQPYNFGWTTKLRKWQKRYASSITKPWACEADGHDLQAWANSCSNYSAAICAYTQEQKTKFWLTRERGRGITKRTDLLPDDVERVRWGVHAEESAGGRSTTERWGMSEFNSPPRNPSAKPTALGSQLCACYCISDGGSWKTWGLEAGCRTGGRLGSKAMERGRRGRWLGLGAKDGSWGAVLSRSCLF
jgi:hypothetical protein